MTKTLPLAALSLSEGPPSLDASKVTRIAKALAGGGVLPPIKVSRRSGGYLVRDGHHRVAAARLAGLETVPVLVDVDR